VRREEGRAGRARGDWQGAATARWLQPTLTAAGAPIVSIPNSPSADPALVYDLLDTPIGPLLLIGGGRGLRSIDFPHNGRASMPAVGLTRDAAPLAAAAQQLREYFAGERREFDLLLDLQGTPFQRAVWEALLEIPIASTVSYGELAQRLGRPSASRAVGAANGANPVPVIVPCHRVIGASGSLTGFGGGLPIKRWLLDHERRHAPRPPLQLVP
jgi:methylated-DNA-[protein]-cysteine S-methyltransferase